MAGRKPTVSDETILSVFEDHDEEILTTTDVSGELDIGQKGTLQRLKKLEGEGKLESRDLGNQYIWTLPADAT